MQIRPRWIMYGKVNGWRCKCYVCPESLKITSSVDRCILRRLRHLYGRIGQNNDDRVDDGIRARRSLQRHHQPRPHRRLHPFPRPSPLIPLLFLPTKTTWEDLQSVRSGAAAPSLHDKRKRRYFR